MILKASSTNYTPTIEREGSWILGHGRAWWDEDHLIRLGGTRGEFDLITIYDCDGQNIPRTWMGLLDFYDLFLRGRNGIGIGIGIETIRWNRIWVSIIQRRLLEK